MAAIFLAITRQPLEVETCSNPEDPESLLVLILKNCEVLDFFVNDVIIRVGFAFFA